MGSDGRISIDTIDTNFTVGGELDASTSPLLASAFADAPVGAEQFVVDLGAVTFIDSSGLRVLIAFNDRVTADGGTVIVSNPSSSVRRLLQITGLESMFGLSTDPSVGITSTTRPAP